MPFSEQAQQYVQRYHQWEALDQRQFNAGLSDLVVAAKQSAADQMVTLELEHDLRGEMLATALGQNEARDQQLQELEELTQTAQGLLTDEQIAAKKAEIIATHPEASEAETTFATAFVVARVMGETILPALTSLDTATDSNETPATYPEYPGTVPVLTYREAYFIVGTLAGRGERIQELRQEGLELPSTEDLEKVWPQLRESMSLDERQEIDAMFVQPTTIPNEELVRAERRRAADRVVQIIEAGEFGDQYEYLIDRFDELDPRCYVMDFIDSVPEEQLDNLHQLLQRIADPMVPIIAMSGRTVRHELAQPTPTDSSEQNPQGDHEVVGLADDAASTHDDYETPATDTAPDQSDTLANPDWITSTVTEAFDNMIDMYQTYGLDLAGKITTSDLSKFPMITFSLRTQAKAINGLLSDSARKSSKKARHDFIDTVLLAAYSLRSDLFDNLEEFTEQEQRELRSTRPREVRRIAESLLRQHLESMQTTQS